MEKMVRKLKTVSKQFGNFTIKATASQTPLSAGASVKVYILLGEHLISCSNCRLDLLNDENLIKLIDREWTEAQSDLAYDEFVSLN